jgi:hypothetical protein
MPVDITTEGLIASTYAGERLAAPVSGAMYAPPRSPQARQASMVSPMRNGRPAPYEVMRTPGMLPSSRKVIGSMHKRRCYCPLREERW